MAEVLPWPRFLPSLDTKIMNIKRSFSENENIRYKLKVSLLIFIFHSN